MHQRQPEIAVAAGDWLTVLSMDGSWEWVAAVGDPSGLAGCSGYDVDGDGAYEVLYADEQRLYIFDGTTGNTLYSSAEHTSGTLWEHPVVADVDADGAAEIVVVSNIGDLNGVTVFGHQGDGWDPSGPTWGIHDFAVTNLSPDGSVPSPLDPPWWDLNVFRARPVIDEPDPLGTPDLFPEFGELCVASCADGPVKLSYRVCNQGGLDTYQLVPVSLYTVDQGVRTLVGTQVLPPLPMGECLSGGVFQFHPDLWGDGFVLWVDDNDNGNGTAAVDECDEGNNEFEYLESLCY